MSFSPLNNSSTVCQKATFQVCMSFSICSTFYNLRYPYFNPHKATELLFSFHKEGRKQKLKQTEIFRGRADFCLSIYTFLRTVICCIAIICVLDTSVWSYEQLKLLQYTWVYQKVSENGIEKEVCFCTKTLKLMYSLFITLNLHDLFQDPSYAWISAFNCTSLILLLNSISHECFGCIVIFFKHPFVSSVC